ncbi:Leucine-rich repeats and immunoglobulin-like domains protein 3 [Portunus trituberculatus]|uniref:Leucine-rich repeats and immunoglobulin-like domains protein 3 n=1 Tax=Portunus trituberculatus TaxID=210409 RepID=A0A5B7E0E0_PORTR|nr:Leucine-rich repeats and immunoglobulin-like domains protein 3 [Portunus trituberculatus]
MNIVEFTQRNAGIQALRGQLFTASDLPLRKVDFSRNAIRRLNMDVLEGLESHLLELHLDHNLLGNNFNPSFSFSEVAKLTALQTLNLAFNHIREMDVGFLATLISLEVLHLEGNSFLAMPTPALKGLDKLKVLTLQENDIDIIKKSALLETPTLVFLNVSHNRIVNLEVDAFMELSELVTLDLSYNRLANLQGGTFNGLTNLEELDVSSNFLMEVPADALKDLTKLRTLVLHDNLIQVGQMIGINIDNLIQTLGGIVALGPMVNIQHLDLTRNNIGELPTGTFRQLSGLRILKLAVNSMRQFHQETLWVPELDEEGLSDVLICFIVTL